MAELLNKKRPTKKLKKIIQKIGIVPTDELLTGASGLGSLMEFFEESGLVEEFRECLPERVSNRSIGSAELGMIVMSSFLFGYDSIRDIDKFRLDPKFRELFGKDVAASRTINDFLKDFTPEHINKLNAFLSKMSHFIRDHLNKILPEEHQRTNQIIDVDSTSHIQYGEQIEGCAYNYKNEWCLDSQISYDQLGFCYGFQLRPGNTKSGEDVVALIEQSFRDGKTSLERKHHFEDYFRADSAYCKQDVIKCLLDMGVHFTLTAHDGVTRWKSQMQKEGLDWQEWVYSEDELKKASNQDKELPRREVTRMHWSPGWSKKNGSKLVFPILIKRTWSKKKEEKIRREGVQKDFLKMDGFMEEEPWEYYAVVTDLPLDVDRDSSKKNQRYWSIQEVFEHHQKRGHAENFIREEKYNHKLKNFPCQRLLANHAYGLLAQVAHNLLRWVALIMEPGKPHFSKWLRNHYLFIPGKIIFHSGYQLIKVMRHYYEEVMKLREACGLKPARVPTYYSTA